jgi:glutathione S-transferase
MSLVFYFAPMSTATITAAVLAELGVACERVHMPIGPQGTQSEAFLKINPNGRVPTVVHDGVAIWESSAITMYLGEQFGVQAGLYPPPGPHRGEAMKWIAWASTTLAAAAGRLSLALPPDAIGAVETGSVDHGADRDAAQTARSDIAALLAILERALAERPFLVGDFSLADAHLYPLVAWIMSMDIPLPDAVAAWFTRCSARPALAAAMG